MARASVAPPHSSHRLYSFPHLPPTPPFPLHQAVPLPYGVFRELLVLDCNGGLHMMPNTPLEVNANLRGVRHALNFAADEIRSRAECVASGSLGSWCVVVGVTCLRLPW